MSAGVQEAIQRGYAFATRALDADKKACQNNDPASYEVARTNYEQSIEQYRYAYGVEQHPASKEVLQKKIAMYSRRYNIMEDWLTQYRQSVGVQPQPLPEREPHISDPDLPVYLRPQSPVPQPPPQPPPLPPAQTPPQPPPQSVVSPRSVAPTPMPSRRSPQGNRDGPISPPQAVSAAPPLAASAAMREAQMRARLREMTLTPKPNVRWDDVAGLTAAKDTLMEATTLHDMMPQLFGAERKRWKTILLYGPPGVGKSHLAKAVATEAKAKFYMLTMYDLMAKLEGECERMVKALFSMAKEEGKVIVFFDDVDVLFSNRSERESESFRRIRSQFLAELQELREADDDVVLLAATRTPWVLDDAFLRRMDRRIYIPLPDAKARAHMLQEQMQNVDHNVTLQEIADFADECEGYTGADILMLVRDAVMEPIRVIKNASFFKRIDVTENGRKIQKMIPCEREDSGAIETQFTSIPPEELHPPPVTCLDLDLALASSKPTVGEDAVKRHIQFTIDRGQHGS